MVRDRYQYYPFHDDDFLFQEVRAEDSVDDTEPGCRILNEVLEQYSAARTVLVRQCDIKGILHSHTKYCDGAHSLCHMVETAQQIGLEYLGISDHLQTDQRQDGIDLQTIKVQRQEIAGLRKRIRNFDVLHGVEVDANPDGSLKADDDVLELFDYVIASLPDDPSASKEEWTEQIIAVANNPRVNILSKPIGDYMLRPSPLPVDMHAVLKAAVQTGTAVEIDANPQCFELDGGFCQQAQEIGAMMVISPDAHRAARLVDYRHGVELARDAGVCCLNIMNTLPSRDLRKYLKC